MTDILGKRPPPARRYARKRKPGSFTRLVIELPCNELADADAWGIAAKMPSRTAVIRHLIQIGLKNEASGQAGKHVPDASAQ